MKAKYRAKKDAKEKTAAENDAATSESEDGADSSPTKPPSAKKRRVGMDVEEDSASAATASPAKKQKPLKAKTDSQSSRPGLTSTKASKPLKPSTAGILSKRSEKPTAKSKEKLVGKPTTSPLKAAVSKDVKVMKKRKRRDAPS